MGDTGRDIVFLERCGDFACERHHAIVDGRTHVVEDREAGILTNLRRDVVQHLQVLALTGLGGRGCDEYRESQRPEHELLQHLASSCRQHRLR
jgi:hypothetical protein